mmetsp:Transcript_3673/g.15539  ORF Transcript_3673/g.15539 Transcript_3673/m.15539 type:complete len:242 (+) Transcript_3673:613-1338(+)
MCRQPPDAAVMGPPANSGSSLGVQWSTQSPCPSWPYLLHPNVQSLPPSVSAALCLQPQIGSVMCWSFRLSTKVGTCRSRAWPCPRFPYRPHPNVNMAPRSSVTALCSAPPAARRTRKPASLKKGTTHGFSLSSVSPKPSWPFWFRPNENSVPSRATTKQWLSPHATFSMGMPLRASMGVGACLSPGSPVPSLPKSPQPQAYTSLWGATATAMVWCAPQVTFSSSTSARSETSRGTEMSSLS